MRHGIDARHTIRSNSIALHKSLPACALLLILMLASIVSAQTFRGTILGTVTDPNGAVTPDVGIGNPFMGGGGPRNIQLALKLIF